MNAAACPSTPTLQQELDRKVYETIDKLVSDYNLGRITLAQYAYGVDMIWSVSSGLVDDDFVTIMGELGKMRKDGSFFTRTYLRDSAGNAAKVTNMHDGRVRVELMPIDPVRAEVEKVFDFRSEVLSMQSAQQKERSLIDGLMKKGYLEI